MAAAALKYLSLTNRFTGDFYLSFSRYLKKIEKKEETSTPRASAEYLGSSAQDLATCNGDAAETR